MIFVINNLKYDTDKMELISDECEYWYKGELLGTPMRYRGRDVRLWRSSKGNWLLTYKSDYTTYGKALCEKEVENILIRYDLEMYEQIFGEVEEASSYMFLYGGQCHRESIIIKNIQIITDGISYILCTSFGLLGTLLPHCWHSYGQWN